MNKEIKYQLADFELSKLLRESGYNECDVFYYRDSFESDIKLIPEICFIGKLYDNHNHRINILHPEALCTAPMLSNVQYWLRSEFNIHMEIKKSSNPSMGFWVEIDKWGNEEIIENSAREWFDSYENALKDGIKESLKYINK